jgi:lipoyl(octanoyl) transferase
MSIKGYNIIDLGLIEYLKAYAFQKDITRKVRLNTIKGALILAEHFPVFTIGRSSKVNNLLLDPSDIRSRGIDIVDIDRGGDITFHGPGQLVVYPVLDLNRHKKDLHKYLRDLESVIILALSEYNIAAFRLNGKTGCWVDDGKIASIGISSKNWITYHGFSVNLNLNLDYFNMINPCGYKDIKITSISKSCKEKNISMDQLKHAIVQGFAQVFNVSFLPQTVDQYAKNL